MNSDLEKRINELTNRLLECHEKRQEELDNARQEEASKYESEIKVLENQLQNAKIQKDNMEKDLKDIKKLLKKVKEVEKEEIQKAIAEKAAQFDYAPKILEACDSIENNLGKDLFKLESLCLSLENNIDYISQQRVLGIIKAVRNIVNEIEKCIDINNFDNNIDENDSILYLEKSEEDDEDNTDIFDMKDDNGLNFSFVD